MQPIFKNSHSTKKAIFLMLLSVLFSLNVYSQYFFTMDVGANYIEYDSKRELIYATVAGTDANYPNSLVAINPYEGKVVKNIFIGSEPTEFVFTTDSDYLFIMFEEQPLVKRFDLNNFSLVEDIYLGTDKYYGAFFGKSMAVLPDNNSAVIVSRKRKDVSPDFGGVAVYSNGVKLPKETMDHHGPEYLINTQSETLFAYKNDFFVLEVDLDSGIQIVEEYKKLGLFEAQSDGELIFDNRGKVVNPEIPAQIGKISISSDIYKYYPHKSDSALGKVFYAYVDGYREELKFASYSRDTYGKIAEYAVPDVIPSRYQSPETSKLIRFGSNGLATILYDDYYFSEEEATICILNNSSFVDSIAVVDTSELAQLFILDTVYSYEHVTVYDTINFYNYVTVYDTIPVSTIDTLEVYRTTSNVNGNIIESKITLYPNPANSYINVEIINGNVIENYSIQLYNVQGEILFDSSLSSNNLVIDISSYAKGTYILRVKNQYGQNLSTKYVIVQ